MRNLPAQNFRSLIFILPFVFLIASFSHAAPCYGTRMPEKKKIFAGAQTYSIFKRYLENASGKLRSTQHFMLLSYGAYDWLSIDLKIGEGNIKQRPTDSSEIDYLSNFAGGYGLRIKLYDRKKIKAVWGFQHISVHPKSLHFGSREHEAILDDWQFSFLVSRSVFKTTPYLGARWSRLDYIHRFENNKKRVMSDATKSLGLISGIDISITDRIWLNLEGQFLDSEACALSLNFKF
jgi:hypothetical protein